jgi:hypothetical protein
MPTVQMNRWWKRISLGLAAALALYTLAGAVLLPWIARSQVERFASERLHRRLEIASLHLNPFTLRASAQGLRMLEADGRTDFVTVDRIELALSPASILQAAPVVTELHVVRPVVHWARLGENRFSTDDLVAALASTSPVPPPAPEPGARPARYSLADLRIEGGRLDFDDQPAHARHVVTDLEFALPRLSTLRDPRSASASPRLAATVDGSAFELKGEIRPFGAVREATLRFDLDRFDLARIAGYIPQVAPVRAPAGHLDLHLQIALQEEEGREPRIELRGSAVLDALELSAADGRRILALPHVELDLAHAQFPEGRLEAEARLAGGGRLALAGEASFDAPRLELDVEANRFDLAPWQRFAGERLNFLLARGAVGAKGHLVLERGADGAMQASYRGDAGLDGLAVVDKATGGDILRWRRLAVRGIKLATSPFAFTADQVELADWFARLALDPAGRLNVLDLVRSAPDAAAAGPVPPPAVAAAAAAATAAKPPARASALAVSIHRIVLRAGNVRFSDHFIQPNYSAELADLSGTIANLVPEAAQRARVDLQGRVNGAPLVISGTVQPLATPLFLDLQASVQGMDIVPFTPYSSRYVGYRIDGGKLSFDVNYHVENREIQARNRLVLDQLELGDRVEGADVTTLPVRFAIALLKDRDGVIDVNVPISGSLDAPDFSVAGVVFRALGNLIVKVATSPFTFLGSLFGSGEQESWVAYEPGGISAAAASLPRIETIAKAMLARPGLELEITGYADPVADTGALRRQLLERSVRALRRREQAARIAQGGAPAQDLEAGEVPAAEVPGLLRRLTGAAPAVPDPDLEALALSRIDVGEADLIALGNRRGQWVRDWLVQEGKVPVGRIFLRAGRPAPPGAAAQGAPPPSRVEFGLK